ncbi:hypothetical protein HIM_10203 [Hirsutella minnesotensis 3608]|uniref:Uncharacterized protein n=1 Tax=Hirsutella minnesotensis 3608 TaxID=1043627 RepID=A0A0F8A2I4_9HYPO|nr:hypothetical protein HIM_10203 [Hirsutella minnesotensis 3608]
MGAQQSSSQSANNANTKTCYYVLLDVQPDASDHEIKKAYRKKALELHPDRNINDVKSATERFAEVQAAYDVLSDPHERAWYDSHRDAILSGQEDKLGSGAGSSTFRNIRLTTTEEILSLVRRFNATIPFNDEPDGFYGIARATFEQLGLEEDATAEDSSLTEPVYSSFGFADDDYDSVVKPFYACWAGFSTKKSFAWMDKYRLSDAPDRRTRRFMEKENRKAREDAAQKFNDAVTFLVGFVRKRDPRYLPNSQTEAERQQLLRSVVAAQAARSRAANQEKMASCHVPEWVSGTGNEAQEDFFSEESEESEVEVLECVVCNKCFKSAKQLEAHERSKKHAKTVQELRRHMEKEGNELELDMKQPKSTNTDEASQVESDARPTITSANLDGEPEPQVTAQNSSSTDIQVSPSLSDADDYAPRAAVEERLISSGDQARQVRDAGDECSFSAGMHNIELNCSAEPRRKIGKAKLKREKKKEMARMVDENDIKHICSSCRQPFRSRTQLFRHIRDEGHAAIKTETPAGKNKAAKKKR